MISMAAVLVVAGVLTMAAGSNSGLGFDASTPVSVYNFKQLSAAGYNYTILRGYRCKSGGESVRRSRRELFCMCPDVSVCWVWVGVSPACRVCGPPSLTSGGSRNL